MPIWFNLHPNSNQRFHKGFRGKIAAFIMWFWNRDSRFQIQCSVKRAFTSVFCPSWSSAITSPALFVLFLDGKTRTSTHHINVQNRHQQPWRNALNSLHIVYTTDYRYTPMIPVQSTWNNMIEQQGHVTFTRRQRSGSFIYLLPCRFIVSHYNYDETTNALVRTLLIGIEHCSRRLRATWHQVVEKQNNKRCTMKKCVGRLYSVVLILMNAFI